MASKQDLDILEDCGDRVRRSPSAEMANWRNQAPNAPNPDHSAITAMEGDTDSRENRLNRKMKQNGNIYKHILKFALTLNA